MSEDESFDSFYSKLNEVVIGKFNLGEKAKDSKIVRKILRSLLESFRANVIAIEESKDLDDIKVQELIGSLQTYELSLPSQRKSKSLALKTINERVEVHDSSDEDVVDKDVACSRKMESLLRKENSQVSERRKRILRREMERTLNLLKESLASNAMDTDISRKSVPIICKRREKCMPLL